MSMDFGEGEGLIPSTMRGRDWPCLRQFAVFFENRVGQLHELLRTLEKHDLRVIGLSVSDSIDYSVARIIVDNYERATEIISLCSFKSFETDILGVLLPDDPQPFLRICTALLQGEVNIHYAYPLLFRRNGRGAIALHVDDLDQGMETLKAKELILLTENDLIDDDEFF
jgi:hypothetical protein